MKTIKELLTLCESDFDPNDAPRKKRLFYSDTDGIEWNQQTKNLIGCPEKIDGYFNATFRGLESLEGGPTIVNGDFNVASNNLTSLEHGPKQVSGTYSCYDNKLTTLKGMPDDYVESLIASDNQIHSFEGIPKIIKEAFVIRGNKIISLEGIADHLTKCDRINLSGNDIQVGGVGLLLIDDLEEILYDRLLDTVYNKNFAKALKIIERHLKTKDVYECQKELIDAGLEEYAQI